MKSATRAYGAVLCDSKTFSVTVKPTLALGSDASARRMMEGLAEIKVTLAKTKAGAAGRRPTAMLAPERTAEQRRAVKLFELDRWAPALFHVAH